MTDLHSAPEIRDSRKHRCRGHPVLSNNSNQTTGLTVLVYSDETIVYKTNRTRTFGDGGDVPRDVRGSESPDTRTRRRWSSTTTNAAVTNCLKSEVACDTRDMHLARARVRESSFDRQSCATSFNKMYIDIRFYQCGLTSIPVQLKYFHLSNF